MNTSLPLDVLRAVIPGLVVGIFDRSCTYTAIDGGEESNLAVGRKVGSLNLECGAQLFELARRAISPGESAQVYVHFKGRSLDVRISPLRQTLFGIEIVGGVLAAWDVADEVGRPPRISLP